MLEKKVIWIDKVSLLISFLIFSLATLILIINQHSWHFSISNVYRSLPSTPDGSAVLKQMSMYFGYWKYDFLLLLSCTAFFAFRKGLDAKITQIFIHFLAFWGIVCLILYATMAVELTPFSLIDKELLHWDEILHFHTIYLIETLAHYPQFKKILFQAYDALLLEILFVPFYLIIAGRYQTAKWYFYLLLSTTLLGYIIYYFWPSTSPASLLNSPYFFEAQKNISLNFYNIHHHMQPISNVGGPIGMPSFHVIWAVLCQYSTWRIKWLSIMLFPINGLIILSTLFLGWHYFVDILGAFFVLGLSFSLPLVIHQKYRFLNS